MSRHTGPKDEALALVSKSCMLSFACVFAVMVGLGAVISESRSAAETQRMELFATGDVTPLMRHSKAYQDLGKNLIESVRGAIG